MTRDAPVPAFADSMLRSAVASALAGVAPTPESDFGAVSGAHWTLAAKMGWTATMVSESDGGLGLGPAYVADICEEAGRHLFCGPLAETAVLLPAIARETGALSDLLPGVVSGEVRVAYAEGHLGDEASAIAPVEHAADATHVVNLAGDGRGLQATVIAAGDAALVPLRPMDMTAPVARAEIVGPSRALRVTLEAAAAGRVLTAVHVAVAADLLGVGEAALERTVEHVCERTQFGQPIGAFQVIKHRLADIQTAIGAARLSIAHAVREAGTVGDARIARVLSAEAALKAAAAAIQLHGGSGFSWELDLHLYLKRARRLNARNGGTSRLRAESGDDFIERAMAAAP